MPNSLTSKTMNPEAEQKPEGRSFQKESEIRGGINFLENAKTDPKNSARMVYDHLEING